MSLPLSAHDRCCMRIRRIFFFQSSSSIPFLSSGSSCTCAWLAPTALASLSSFCHDHARSAFVIKLVSETIHTCIRSKIETFAHVWLKYIASAVEHKRFSVPLKKTSCHDSSIRAHSLSN